MTEDGVSRVVAAANESFVEAFARGDAASMAEHYTENGWLLPMGSRIVRGRHAIGQYWQMVIRSGIRRAELETVELESHGDTAIEVGTYTLRGDGTEVLDTGKYIVVWKREGGRWKLHRDMWNTNNPLQ